MNETLSSSLWPNFSTSRSNLNDQFSLGSMSAWQQNISTTDIYTPDDYNNVWSAKSNIYEENEKESIIKSIWSTNASPNNSCTETNSHVSDASKNIDETPTNSPSLKRIEIINCNDRWGNVKINQITPWSVIGLEESEQRPHDPMVWRAKIDGTEVWEDYYVRQHGRRLPQTDSAFNGDNVWSSASEISQSTNSVWPPNKNDINAPIGDIFSPNLFNDTNNRQSFSSLNGVRPSMTRNQAQKYLIDMGYSLSDAIGALVNNQMDLPKAINELQSKYRMSSAGCPTLPNGMYTPSLSFNNSRPGDNANMPRIAPGTPINQAMLAANNNNSPAINSMIPSSHNFNNNFDMFHQDHSEQMLDSSSSSYMNMDPMMTQYGRMTDMKGQGSMPMTRDSSFRNTFPNNVMNSRTMSTNNNSCASQPQFNGDMNVLNQGMNRMNLSSFNAGMLAAQQNNNNCSQFAANKWSSSNVNNANNGYNQIMHNNGSNAALSNGMLNSNNAAMDMRQNYGASSVLASAIGRSYPKQQLYQRNPNGAMAWHGSAESTSISPNGALNDINQLRLAKNMSCAGTISDNYAGIIIRKVPSQHIEIIKSICYDSGTMTNFQLQPHTQSILVYFSSLLDARRCMNIIQSQINSRVELIGDDYLHNCQ